jgi:hypothetical protein
MTIEADFSHFAEFATVFFGARIEKLEKKGFKKPERCTLIVHNKMNRETEVDLLWLANFLKQKPGFGVKFDLGPGYEKVASNLNLLVRALREKWKITNRVKKVGDGPSWSNDRVRNRQGDRLLVSLGLLKHVSELPPGNALERSFDEFLRSIYEGSKYGSVVPRLEIKVFQEHGSKVYTFPTNYSRPRG